MTLEFHRVDPSLELEQLRAFLASSDPDDYLLEEIDEWVRKDRLWVGVDGDAWIAFGRLHDLGSGDGWVSGVRVVPDRRGQGVGGALVDRILSDASSVGITEARAVIDNENLTSARLFIRHGFERVTELTLRCGSPSDSPPPEVLHRALPGEPLPGPIGWLPAATGRVDLLPGADGGRFGRWDPGLVRRWAEEGKLFVGAGCAVAVQTDWWQKPRTLWANPLVGAVPAVVGALSGLTRALEHEEWQAFLPSGEENRAEYDRLGLRRHPHWGDRVGLFERREPPVG